MSKKNNQLYRNEINGLRAFAVIAVIINHFNKDILPSGYLGVDIFFVISGYVITSSLFGRKSENFWDFISGFYVRRIKRLIPALIIFILIFYLLICFFNPNTELTLRTGISSLFGLSNLYLLKQSTNYFAQSTNLNIFSHTWSLGVEEQFYILFPLIVWVTGFGRQTSKGARNLFITLLFLVICSLISFVYLYPINQPAAYFLMPTRFWEIASGSLLFILTNNRGFVFEKIERFPPLIILLSMILVMFLPKYFAVPSTILIVIFTVFLMICLRKDTLAFEFLTKEKVVYIGLISYSLYLWHWGIITISIWTIGIRWWTIPFQVFLIYIFSVASYKWVETPLRRVTWSFQNWKSILKGFSILILTSISLFVSHKPFRNIYLGKSTQDSNNDWRYNIQSVNNKINGKKCHADIFYSEEDIANLFKNCKIKNSNEKEKNKTVAFLGDSHVLAMVNAQKMIYKEGGNIIHYSFSNCPFPKPIHGIYPHQCDEFQKTSSQKILTTLNQGDYIIINNYNLSHLGDKSLRKVRHNIYNKQKNRPHDGNTKLKIYAQSLINFSQKAQKQGIKIIFIGSNLRNTLSYARYKEWFRPFPPKWIYKEEYKNAEKLNNQLSVYLSGMENLVFFNPLKEVESCNNNIQFFICYRDGSHLSDYGALEYMKKLVPIIFKEK